MQTMKDREESSVLSGAVSRRKLAGSAVALLGFGHAMHAWAEGVDEITRNAESIHQEPVFEASRERVYQALTDRNHFDKIMHLGAAMKSGAVPGGKPAQIEARAGGAFSLFGGYISGRNLELVPNERIVQAWRVGSWKAGA